MKYDFLRIEKIILTTLLFLTLTALFLANYDNGIDFHAYKDDYGNIDSRFEIGYKYISIFFANFTSFEVFLIILLTIEALLISLIYKNKKCLIFLPFSISFTYEIIYINQIRWGIASLFFIYLFQQKEFSIKKIIPFSFHYSTILLITLPYFKIIKFRYFLIISIMIFFISEFFLEKILSLTIYSYYLNTHYLEPRSLSSIAYSFVVFLAHPFIKSAKDIKINIFYYGNLLSIAFSNFAIISGRILDAIIILEPFFLWFLFNKKGTSGKILGTAFLLILIIRLVMR